ncbi:hypothetical protein JHN59_01825 [Streptomyces sp. MBT49]|uniref:hypothetical protein n=1 Tax=Streptomyces sp. MBT49 TaxID=1488380 RepID=UPI00190CCC95|nr:hypothetical protein [Streptomyces sp. MBT49]MBK3623600.1 hypothetical protein [Streptomyces sp. MBT49]
MNGSALVLRALHRGEKRLAGRLTTVAQDHRAEHEVRHVATDLARWSREHVDLLAEAAMDHGLNLDELPPEGGSGGSEWSGGTERSSGSGSGAGADGGVPTAVLEGTAEIVGRRPEPGLLLLRDLRDLHLAATENSLYWEMLAQAAQAGRDDALLALASSCHPQTLRQMRWSNTMIKNLSPQILTSL